MFYWKPPDLVFRSWSHQTGSLIPKQEDILHKLIVKIMQNWWPIDLTDASKILTLGCFKMILFLSCTYWWWKVVSCRIGKWVFCCINKLTPHLTFWKANLHPERFSFADAIIEQSYCCNLELMHQQLQTFWQIERREEEI